ARTTAIAVARNPTAIELCAPYTAPAQTSHPWMSKPNGCPGADGTALSARSHARGSPSPRRAANGAGATAKASMMRSTTPAAHTRGRCSRRRQTPSRFADEVGTAVVLGTVVLATADPRVEQGLQGVHDQRR